MLKHPILKVTIIALFLWLGLGSFYAVAFGPVNSAAIDRLLPTNTEISPLDHAAKIGLGAAGLDNVIIKDVTV